MATHKSAVKTNRRAEANRIINRGHRSQMRSQVKRLRQAIAAGNRDEASSQLKPTLSILDHSAKLGVIHANMAARSKSRLTRQVSNLGS